MVFLLVGINLPAEQEHKRAIEADDRKREAEKLKSEREKQRLIKQYETRLYRSRSNEGRLKRL
jgi:hypothetical protein